MIEVLISLSIASVAVMAMLSPTSNGFFRNEDAIRKKALAAYNFSIIKGLIQSDLHFLDEARISANPVFIDGNPTFSDHSVINLSIPPKLDFQWWGFTRPYFIPLLFLEDLQIESAQSIKAVICDTGLENIPFVGTEGVAICDAGSQEVLIQPIRSFHPSAKPSVLCWEVRVRKTPNMVIRNGNTWDLPFSTAVQLVDEKFFYYTSRANELRRVQIRDGSVIENQPVLADFYDRMTLMQTYEPAPHVLLEDSTHLFSVPLFRSLQPILPAAVSTSLLQIHP